MLAKEKEMYDKKRYEEMKKVLNDYIQEFGANNVLWEIADLINEVKLATLESLDDELERASLMTDFDYVIEDVCKAAKGIHSIEKNLTSPE